MQLIIELVRDYGLGIVFLNVLIEQLGAPLPAYPVLVVTGAIAANGAERWLLVGVAVLAALLADGIWYTLGQRYGRRVMSRLCRISLSPDSCVRQTEALYTRIGPKSLLVAKFIPGFASVASALAGVVETPRRRFLLLDGLGACIWVGSAVLLGQLFSSAVEELLAVLTALGQWGVLLITLGLAVFLARKWWTRRQLIRSLRMARVTVDELRHMLASDRPPVVLDVRSQAAYGESHIPGAYVFEPGASRQSLPVVAADEEVVVYCACPNEASAAIVARTLQRAGYHKVRPLLGGLEAWVAAGYDVHGQDPHAAVVSGTAVAV